MIKSFKEMLYKIFTYVKQISKIFNKRQRIVLVLLVLITLWMCFWVGVETLWSTTDLLQPPQQKIFIAANFYNNEDILPNFSEKLLILVNILRPENVYVSIFENGSKDNTKILLRTLQADLNIADIANTIITEEAPHSYVKGYRISYLANLRNKVLEPLHEQAKKGNKYDKILFFNDIIWTVKDILTLLGTNDYSYDAVCAMDFYWTFYDIFATRELSSPPDLNYPWPPTPYYPYFYNTVVQQNFYNNEPAQVFSCWNGVAIMNAEPFTKYDVKFRSLISYEDIFDASECCLIYSDFRKYGYNKVFINPNVKVSYLYRFYLWSNYFLPVIDKLIFRYFNHPTPPSLFSDAGIQMQEMIGNLEKFNVTESDRICVHSFK